MNLCGFFNFKFNKNIIINFIKNIDKIKDKGYYNKRNTSFGYGTDELFLNEYLIYKNNNFIKNIQLGVIFNYNINWWLYYNKNDLLLECEKETRKNLIFIINKYFNNNMTTNDMFDFIDKHIYNINNIKNNDNISKYLIKNFYKLMIKLQNDKKEWFSLDNIKLINKYYNNIISCLSIIFFSHNTLKITNIKNYNIKYN
jgi:hypothetical protein